MSERMKKLEVLLVDDPDNSFLLFAIAKEYEGLGEMEKALAQYLLLKGKDANYVGLYYHLGKLQEKMDDFAGALDSYTAGMAVAKAQGDMHAHGELSTAHWEISDED